MTASDDQGPVQPAGDPADQPVAPSAPQLDPPSAFPAFPAAPPPYAQPGYGQQYPPAGSGQPAYAQPPWPVYGPPEHPRANLAFVLALVGGPGAFLTCGLTLLLAPFAWYFAAQARRETAAYPGRWSTDTSKATAALVLGIIGTVLLALAIIAVAVVIVVAIADPGAFDSGTTV